MGTAAYRQWRAPDFQKLSPYSAQQHDGNVDYFSRSHSYIMTEAPWDVTQWIDPFEPQTKMTTMPVLLIIRK
ncbi:unnamed protein product [Rotaria sordida]|uniref:Uncharacterized protein n=1 Tax=Rotaria sordida TaxID=392033 RepID=A0A814BC37_9BILA|nr:unnamed protein product [Rotaria sordida]CAF0904734.1 unnamed protein product [Rotaria sordida]CAF0911192.1 unnamed protein product [Rotaria sordida]CAF0915443.1 unnamed protein product [Rotaria sordida]CAF0924674.1 unnamed protein product [Rotaria sordida]